jgi:hypothetical protein
MEHTRRGLLLGFGALVAAPAIVRVESLMKVRPLPPASWGSVINANCDQWLTTSIPNQAIGLEDLRRAMEAMGLNDPDRYLALPARHIAWPRWTDRFASDRARFIADAGPGVKHSFQP